MSAFVCILDRRGAPVPPRLLDRLAEPLAPYGDGLSTFTRGPLAIAIRHRGEADLRRHGPLVDPATGLVTAVVGRFSPGADQPAATALAAVSSADPADRDDLSFLSSIEGAFTLIVADPATGRVAIARDHLGSLKVYYHLGPHLLVAASEADAIVRHEAVSSDPDEGSAARFLGFRFGWTERSFYREVRELPPAHRLEVTPESERIDRYWRFEARSGRAERDPEAVTARFRRLLGESVAREMEGLPPERIALSLSGGLDSTAVAALAPPGFRAFSWTFDDPALGDESARVDAVSRQLGLPVARLRGDDLHPFAHGVDDFAERFVSAGSPWVNPFADLKAGLYRAAREAGCQRVLVGDAGDALYAAREYWLRDAIRSGAPGGLARTVGRLTATVERAFAGDRFARLSLLRVLPVAGLRSRWREGPLGREPAWLTPEGRAHLPRTSRSPILPPAPFGRPRHRHALVAGARHTELESEERRLFARCGVERGNPFWSRPLLEWSMGLPAHWLHRDGRDKVLTREALRDRLPREVLEGERSGLLGALFLRGLGNARDELEETVFRRPRSDWRRWVRADWLAPYLPPRDAPPGPLAFGHTILWRVIAYELWHRKRIGGGA